MVRRHPSSVARSVPGCPSQLPAQGQALLPPCQPRAQHQPLPCNTHPRSALMNLSWRSRRVGVHAAGPLQAACSSGSARAGRRHRQQPWGGGVGGRRETLRPESRPQQPQQVRVTGAGGQQPASPSSVHSHQPPATSHMRTPAPLHTHPCTPHTHILPPTYTTHSIPSPLAHTSTPHPILPPLHPRAPHLPLPHIPCIHTPLHPHSLPPLPHHTHPPLLTTFTPSPSPTTLTPTPTPTILTPTCHTHTHICTYPPLTPHSTTFTHLPQPYSTIFPLPHTSYPYTTPISTSTHPYPPIHIRPPTPLHTPYPSYIHTHLSTYWHTRTQPPSSPHHVGEGSTLVLAERGRGRGKGRRGEEGKQAGSGRDRQGGQQKALEAEREKS